MAGAVDLAGAGRDTNDLLRLRPRGRHPQSRQATTRDVELTVSMNSADFQLQGVADPRLAVHAAGALPAWLWSLDGGRILWANPVGAGVFDAANASTLASRNFGPADPHRRQVTQLAPCGHVPA